MILSFQKSVLKKEKNLTNKKQGVYSCKRKITKSHLDFNQAEEKRTWKHSAINPEICPHATLCPCPVLDFGLSLIQSTMGIFFLIGMKAVFYCNVRTMNHIEQSKQSTFVVWGDSLFIS